MSSIITTAFSTGVICTENKLAWGCASVPYSRKVLEYETMKNNCLSSCNILAIADCTCTFTAPAPHHCLLCSPIHVVFITYPPMHTLITCPLRCLPSCPHTSRFPMHCVPTAPPLWFTPYCVSSCMYDYICGVP